MPIEMTEAQRRSAAWKNAGGGPCAHAELDYEYYVGDEVVVRTGDLVCLRCGLAAWSMEDFVRERAQTARREDGAPAPALPPLARAAACAHPQARPEHRVIGVHSDLSLQDAPTGLMACTACGEAREGRHFPLHTQIQVPPGWPREMSRGTPAGRARRKRR